MNKVVKGTIALACAVALLGSGTGSLAYWQASSSTDALSLQMGQVDIQKGNAYYELNDSTVSRSELESTPIVPGDVITYRHDFAIAVEGTDAVLRLGELDFGSTNVALQNALSTSYGVEAVSGQSDLLDLGYTGSDRTWNATGVGTIRVTITITVSSEVSDAVTMDDVIYLGPVELALSQVAEPLPEP